MAALTAPRDTPRRLEARRMDRTAAKPLHQGGLAAVDATGCLVPAGDAAAKAVVGVAIRSAAAGDTATVERGVFRFAGSSGADAITVADWGKPAHAVDDQTIAKTDGDTGRLTAGIIRDVDDLGVWIEI